MLQDASADHAWMLAGTFPVWAFDLASLASNLSQQTDWTVRKGVLALEAGDVSLARREFASAARSRSSTESRTLAQRWLELWR